VIDIGGGTADIAVISLGGNVVSNSLRTAGDDFDDAIIRYIRKRDNVIIGERTAEEIKITVGAVYETAVNNEMQVRGRSLVSGLPEIISITTDETRFAMEEAALSIVDAVKSVLEKTPPELSSDILNRGIVLTGGGSLITGMDNLIEEKTGIKTVVADDALQCVALGTGRFIEYQTQRRGFFSFLFR
jgi:rod shape-determining protein MreB